MTERMLTPYQFQDRDIIHNIWGSDKFLASLKFNARESRREINSSIRKIGSDLLQSDDPYTIKKGIQTIRIGMWLDPAIAKDWVENYSESFLNHPHPRIRHSALWNVRTSVWCDTSLADQALKIAQEKLLDEDPSVQRVSLWTHGDAVINKPKLLSSAIPSINSFLSNEKKESSFLFALEEFFIPIKPLAINEEKYNKSLVDIESKNMHRAGTKARLNFLLGRSNNCCGYDTYSAKRQLEDSTINTPYQDMANCGKYSDLLDNLLNDLKGSYKFSDSMKNIWILRNVLWTTLENQEKIHKEISKIILDSNDGDFIRTASVLLGDCIYQEPNLLNEAAIDFVTDFFSSCDNDGSQIVIAQTLLPTVNYNTNQQKDYIRKTLNTNAANPSVQHTIDRLLQHERD